MLIKPANAARDEPLDLKRACARGAGRFYPADRRRVSDAAQRDISSRAAISGWAKPKRAIISPNQIVSILLRLLQSSLAFQLQASRAVRLS